MRGVTIRDFLGGMLVPISCSIGKCRTQVCKSKFKKLTEKFVESNFIKLFLPICLHHCDNLIKCYFYNLGHVFIH